MMNPASQTAAGDELLPAGMYPPICHSICVRILLYTTLYMCPQTAIHIATYRRQLLVTSFSQQVPLFLYV